LPGDPEADAVLNCGRKEDRSGDAEEYAYVAEAARPDGAKTKQRYFDDYLRSNARVRKTGSSRALAHSTIGTNRN
jgi:hypothetical protein